MNRIAVGRRDINTILLIFARFYESISPPIRGAGLAETETNR